MDAGCATDESAHLRTAKSCGPDASTLASSFCGVIRLSDGDNQARSPGRARRKPLKPLRAERRATRCICGDYTGVVVFSRPPGCGCVGYPAFRTPSLSRRRTFVSKPRAKTRGEIAESCSFHCLKLNPTPNTHVVPASEPGPITPGSGVV